MTNSKSINNAINLSIQRGHTIKDISHSWSKLDTVVYFSHSMSSALKEAIYKTEPSLHFYSTEGTPHNSADEGFISDADKVAISFPKGKVKL